MKMMSLEKYKYPHFIGIGGMGMRALAEILLERGIHVSGSDAKDSEFLDTFRRRGSDIFIGHKPDNIAHADCIVVSSAIKEDNPELVEAKKRSIPVFHRSDVLNAILDSAQGIAVAGAHGKSTTSAMTGKIFLDAMEDPTIILGAAVSYLNGNSRQGKGKYVIAEADESDGSFLKFHPYISVVTNVEDDHLDHYGTVENIRNAFVQFINQTDPHGASIVCLDSEGIRAIRGRLEGNVITYGFHPDAEYRAKNKRYEEGLLCFEVYHRETCLGTLKLPIPGNHNVCDALGAAIAGMYCGISFNRIADSLAEFTGAKRRFQTKFKNDKVWIVDDYAHHPTEIRATLAAARETLPKRIICIFQPHRYSRTKLLQDEFAEAFENADFLIFTDIYAAGEEKIEGVDGQLIPHLVQKKYPNKNIWYIPDYERISDKLLPFIQPGDMIITMGAGTIYQTGERLIQLIKENI